MTSFTWLGLTLSRGYAKAASLTAKLFPRKFVIYGCESRGDSHVPYMTRYTLFACAWFSVKIHVFHRSDHDTMHDHPWWFWSLILWNGYVEETPRGSCKFRPLRLLWRPAHTIHRVVLDRGTAVTLVVTGPKFRGWYFYTKDGPVYWSDYFKSLGC